MGKVKIGFFFHLDKAVQMRDEDEVGRELECISRRKVMCSQTTHKTWELNYRNKIHLEKRHRKKHQRKIHCQALFNSSLKEKSGSGVNQVDTQSKDVLNARGSGKEYTFFWRLHFQSEARVASEI